MADGITPLRKLLEDVEYETEIGGANESHAWKDLYIQVCEACVIAARGRVPASDIDDMAQAVIEKILSKDTRERIKNVQSPEGYLRVLARNHAIDLIRLREKERQGRLNYMESREALNIGAERFDKQKLRCLEFVLETLEGEERKLIVWRFWEDCSFVEISARLDIKYSTAAVRMFRLLRRVRAKMEQCLDSGFDT